MPANLKRTRLPHVSSLWHQRACHSNPAIDRLQLRQPNQFRQSDCTERPRFHSFRQSDANAGPLTYTARSLPSRSSRLKVTSGYVLSGRCASLDTLRADLHTDTDSTCLMTPVRQPAVKKHCHSRRPRVRIRRTNWHSKCIKPGCQLVSCGFIRLWWKRSDENVAARPTTTRRT